MFNRGINHVGLSTLDIEGTLGFYRDILDFQIVRDDEIKIEEGGAMRHVFLDCGNRQMISFLAPQNIPEFPEWDTAIYPKLGVPRGFYHFAFHCDSEQELLDRKALLELKGLTVWMMDHDWCRSIYFDDPVNGLALEYCAYSRDLNEDDRTLATRFTASVKIFTHDLEAKARAEAARHAALHLAREQASASS